MGANLCVSERGETMEREQSLEEYGLERDAEGNVKVIKGREMEVKDLPEGLQVGGNLRLTGCRGLTTLPEGLQVGGNLRLTGCRGLTALPEGLKVGRGLFFE